MKARAQKAVELGGKLWNEKRVYLNSSEVKKIIGLEVSRYGTGNISGASINGEKCSNSRARKILNELEFGKSYVCCETGVLFSNLSGWLVEEIQNALG